ncbi:MAG TPA: transporter substrate-binding domain-containing protein [Verrucomicrobiae bacterium]|nr:transporter substrate-binding domain-containing protein [Verrucomicrobiae bacterium]
MTLISAQAAVPTDESPTLAKIKARGELRVGLEAGYMPFEMRDKSGELIGFDIDLAKLMARKLGVKVTVVNQAWDGIIPALLTDKFDVLMGGMTITPERAERVDFCDPYLTIGQTVLLRANLKDRIKSHKDLDTPEFTVLSKLGTTGEIATRKAFKRAKIRTFEHEADAAIEVRNGRADGFVYDLPFNAVMAAQNPKSLVHLHEPFTREDLGWAIRKNDPALRAWLNEFLAGLKKDGRYQALYKKWFESNAWLANVN